jgi:hypothetical protein
MDATGGWVRRLAAQPNELVLEITEQKGLAAAAFGGAWFWRTIEEKVNESKSYRTNGRRSCFCW